MPGREEIGPLRLSSIQCRHCGHGTHVHPITWGGMDKDVNLYRHGSGLVLHGYCIHAWVKSIPPEIDPEVFYRLIETRRNLW